MKKTQSELPPLIRKYLPSDYIDSFTKEIVCNHTITTEEFLDATFNRLPKWITGLLRLRNALVRPLGLNTDRSLHDMICAQSSDEIIFGMPDKHLTFHASLWCGKKEADKQPLCITTVVSYNNTLGWLYFFVIRPFHKIIIHSLLKRVETQCNRTAEWNS